MTLYCKRLFDGARTPLPDGHGAFKLFVASEVEIEPGQYAIVDTGLLLKTTASEALYPVITSNRASLSRGLFVNTFCSMVDTDEDVSKLEFVVFNSGKMRVVLEPGYHIAQLVLLKTLSLTLKDVEQFPEGEPTFKSKDLSIDSIPKSADVWFKKKLVSDQEDTLLQFTALLDPLDAEDFMSKVDKMRISPEYLAAIDQPFFAAKWIHETMPDVMRTAVFDAFKIVKKDALKALSSPT